MNNVYLPELDPRNQPKRYVKLRPVGFGSWCIMEPKEAAAAVAENPECAHEVAEVWMTPSEYEALPEFEGVV